MKDIPGIFFIYTAILIAAVCFINANNSICRVVGVCLFSIAALLFAIIITAVTEE